MSQREITAVMLLEEAGYFVPPIVTFPPPNSGEKTSIMAGKGLMYTKTNKAANRSSTRNSHKIFFKPVFSLKTILFCILSV